MGLKQEIRELIKTGEDQKGFTEKQFNSLVRKMRQLEKKTMYQSTAIGLAIGTLLAIAAKLIA